MSLTPRQQQNINWLVGWGILAILGGGFLYQSNQDQPGPDLCVGEPTKSTVVVLDRTEGIAEHTQDEIVHRVTTGLRTGERVSVFIIDDLSSKSLIPQFNKCKPDVKVNQVISAVGAEKKKAEIQFDDPLLTILRAPVTSASQSPIAEALVDLSRSQYLAASSGTRLMIVSDLIQYTSQGSIYSCQDGKQFVESFAQKHGRPTWRNVDVQLHEIPRKELTKANRQCRNYFWNWFFGDNKGSEAGMTLMQLPGVGALVPEKSS